VGRAVLWIGFKLNFKEGQRSISQLKLQVMAQYLASDLLHISVLILILVYDPVKKMEAVSSLLMQWVKSQVFPLRTPLRGRCLPSASAWHSFTHNLLLLLLLLLLLTSHQPLEKPSLAKPRTLQKFSSLL
jgi:hypothetical protein